MNFVFRKHFNSLLTKGGWELFCVVLFFFMGCEKDKWKQPTTVAISFSVSQPQNSADTLILNEGRINVTALHFAGERKQGASIGFDVGSSFSLDVTSGSVSPPVSFEVPQGTYSKLEMDLSSTGDSTNPSILLKGHYYFSQPAVQTYPVYFEMKTTQIFNLRAKENDGSYEVILEKDKPRNLKVELNLDYWFAGVTSDMWKAAELQDIGGNQTIYVSDKVNANIYIAVLNRVTGGLEAKFE